MLLPYLRTSRHRVVAHTESALQENKLSHLEFPLRLRRLVAALVGALELEALQMRKYGVGLEQLVHAGDELVVVVDVLAGNDDGHGGLEQADELRELGDLPGVELELAVAVRPHGGLLVGVAGDLELGRRLTELLLQVLVVAVGLGLVLPGLVEEVDDVEEDGLVQVLDVVDLRDLDEAAVVPVDDARVVDVFFDHVAAEVVFDAGPESHGKAADGRRVELEDGVQDVVVKAQDIFDFAL